MARRMAQRTSFSTPTLWYIYGRAWYRCLYSALRYASYPGYRLMTPARLRPWKTSDTLFILGGGTSILDMSEADWSEVRGHDSIGLNHWLVHEFVPTFYTSECLPQNPAFVHNLERRIESYRDVPFIFKELDLVRDRPPVFEQLRNRFISVLYGIKGRGEEAFVQMLRFLKAHGFLDVSFVSFTKSASVDWCLLFARSMGYRRVVLLGIDLDLVYFYEKGAERFLSQGMRIPDSGMRGRTIHPTADAEHCSLILPRVIEVLRRELLDPEGIEIFIGSPKSGLHPQLSLYPWPGREAGAGS